MDQVPFDVGFQLGADYLFLHQINRAFQQIFQIKLHTEIAFRRRTPLEFNHHINIAACLRLIARGLTEQRQIGDAETPHQFRLVFCQQF